MILVTEEDFSVDDALRRIRSRRTGAIVSFIGVVREEERHLLVGLDLLRLIRREWPPQGRSPRGAGGRGRVERHLGGRRLGFHRAGRRPGHEREHYDVGGYAQGRPAAEPRPRESTALQNVLEHGAWFSMGLRLWY